MGRSLFSGMAIHVALAAKTKDAITAFINEEGGNVVDLKDSDLVVSRKGHTVVTQCNKLGKVCVGASWVRKSVADESLLAYKEHLIGTVEGKDQGQGAQEEVKIARAQKRRGDAKEGSPPKKQRARRRKAHVAIAAGTDEGVLVPVVKNLGGEIHDLCCRLGDGQPLMALVARGSTAETALAVVCGTPVVSEEWVYASLEKGEWQNTTDYELHRDAVARCKDDADGPFDGLSIYLHGHISNANLGIKKSGLTLLIVRGGGTNADLAKARVIVAFAPFTLPNTSATVVTPSWLLASAEAFSCQPLADHLCPNSIQPSEQPEMPTAGTAEPATVKAKAKSKAKPRGGEDMKEEEEEDNARAPKRAKQAKEQEKTPPPKKAKKEKKKASPQKKAKQEEKPQEKEPSPEKDQPVEDPDADAHSEELVGPVEAPPAEKVETAKEAPVQKEQPREVPKERSPQKPKAKVAKRAASDAAKPAADEARPAEVAVKAAPTGDAVSEDFGGDSDDDSSSDGDCTFDVTDELL